METRLCIVIVRSCSYVNKIRNVYNFTHSNNVYIEPRKHVMISHDENNYQVRRPNFVDTTVSTFKQASYFFI